MNIKRLQIKLILFAMIALLFASSASFAEDSDYPSFMKYRIGVSQYDSSLYYEENGAPSGYITAYFDLLSEYAARDLGIVLSFEYVAIDSYYELERMLVKGDIDFIATNTHTEDFCLRPGKHTSAFLESCVNLDHSVAFLRYALFTLRDERNFMYEDFEGFDKMSIGVIDERNNMEMLDFYAQTNGFTYYRHIYKTRAEMQQALYDGEVDAVVSSYSDSAYSRIIGTLDNVNLYICGNRATNGDGISLLNHLQVLLYHDRPYVNYELSAEYFGTGENRYTAFTAKQRDYITDNPAIRIAVCTNDRPNTYYDEATGEYCGTYIDILKLIESHSLLKFEIVGADTQNDALNMLKNGDVQAILGVYVLDELESAYDLAYTEPFLTKRVAVIGRSGTSVNEGDVHSVGVSGSRTEELIAYMKEYFPSWHEVYFDTTSECFDAVSDGDVDFALLDGDSASALSLESHNEDTGIISSLEYEVDIAIALQKGASELLIDAVSTSVLALTRAEIMSSQMVNYYQQNTDVAAMLKTIAPYILMAVVLIVAVFAVLMISAEHRQHYAEQKATFFANMSHEIRTPINGITGMTELIKKNLDNPLRVEDCANKILFSSNHLLAIINDILDQSKLDNGMMRVVSEEFDIKSMIRSIHSMYINQAHDSQKEFLTSITVLSNEYFMGDETRINQILINLISNAFKFTEAGGRISLLINENADPSGTSAVTFSVSDTGRGIAPEKLSVIFNAYEQESARDGTVHGGTGLGLSISRNLVRLMGGDLTVKSAVGVGSTFSFALPLKPVRKLESLPSDIAHGTALIVDPDKEAASYLTAILMSVGLKVKYVAAPIEALALLQLVGEDKNAFYCCFFDWGVFSAEAVKSAVSLGGAQKFIAMSPLDYSEIYDALTALPIDGFLPKPVFPSDVRELLLRLDSESSPHGLKKYESATPLLTGRHVLIVEDNPLNLEIVEELVSLTDADITCAENGEEAVRLFGDSALGYFDLILMDVQMPVMDGYEATAAIRKLDRSDAKLVSIIAMTANIYSEDVEKAIAAGMDSHLSKPIDLRLLYAALEKFSVAYSGKKKG